MVGSDFYAAVLTAIGAPASAGNIAILTEWARWEGSTCSWNPMDTTQPLAGSWNCNSFACGASVCHVQNYPDQPTGVHGTAVTLTNGYYPTIVAALRADQPLCYWQCTAAIWAEIRTWGTGGFANELQNQCAQGLAQSPCPAPGAGTPPPPTPAAAPAGTSIGWLFVLGGAGIAAWHLARQRGYGVSGCGFGDGKIGR